MNQKALKHALITNQTETLLSANPVRLWRVIGHFNGGVGTFVTGLLRNVKTTGTGAVAKAVVASNAAAANGQGHSWSEEFFGMEFSEGLTAQNVSVNGSLEIIYEQL